jgi:hypothetical protein
VIAAIASRAGSRHWIALERGFDQAPRFLARSPFGPFRRRFEPLRCQPLNGDGMRRRKFIALLGSATVWPLATHAQQPQRIRRIGYITQGPESDARISAQATAFENELRQLGWTTGRNIQIDYRWGALDTDLRQRHIRELLALEPDVMVAVTGSVATALLRETRSIPIVFLETPERGISSFIANRNHPGGNVTGFVNFVDSMYGKWVQLLKEIAPEIETISYMFQCSDNETRGFQCSDNETRGLSCCRRVGGGCAQAESRSFECASAR